MNLPVGNSPIRKRIPDAARPTKPAERPLDWTIPIRVGKDLAQEVVTLIAVNELLRREIAQLKAAQKTN